MGISNLYSRQLLLLLGSAVCFFSSCKKETADNNNNPVIFRGSGDITATVTAFRDQLGTLNTTPGALTGRREINWDGVPDSLSGRQLPADFFNPTAAGSPAGRQRGLVYADQASAMVSKNLFAEINPLAATAFSNFSGNKSFAVVNANSWPVEFRVAGQTTTASVKGFGIVFNDVDAAYSTYLDFYDGDRLLGHYYVPALSGSTGFSFLGVYFPGDRITRVVVNHDGMLASGEKDISQGGARDLVLLDDFIYSEPIKQ